MTSPLTTILTNRLLELLTREEYERLKPHLELVHLARARVLCEAGDTPDYVYFPLSGVISLLSTTEAGEVIEVGMVGNEGTTALPVLMHAREIPYRMVVQVPVDALRIVPGVIQTELSKGGRLHDLVLCYAHQLFTEIAQSAVCNRFHTADQRFCRWLLSTHDRIQSDTVELTHEIISDMLGIQRSLASVTAGAFQKLGIINYTRGSITILVRRRLEAASCQCYRTVKRQVESCSSQCLVSVEPHASG
jgi:CRP-like cAMP-binding protein